MISKAEEGKSQTTFCFHTILLRIVQDISHLLSLSLSLSLFPLFFITFLQVSPSLSLHRFISFFPLSLSRFLFTYQLIHHHFAGLNGFGGIDKDNLCKTYKNVPTPNGAIVFFQAGVFTVGVKICSHCSKNKLQHRLPFKNNHGYTQ